MLSVRRTHAHTPAQGGTGPRTHRSALILGPLHSRVTTASATPCAAAFPANCSQGQCDTNTWPWAQMRSLPAPHCPQGPEHRECSRHQRHRHHRGHGTDARRAGKRCAPPRPATTLGFLQSCPGQPEGEQDRGETAQGVSRKGPDSRGRQARKALLEGGKHKAVS